MRAAFTPPPYPYDRLSGLGRLADEHDGGIVDCSIGTPCDPPAPEVVAALGNSGLERGYPTSQGSAGYREAIAGWLQRRFGMGLPIEQIAACVGTKEMVASTAHYLSLRAPDRDLVL